MPASVVDALGSVAAVEVPRVVIATRVDCHLCQQAEAIAAAVCPAGTWASIDVDAHPAVASQFTDHVPVVWVDGRLLAYWTLTEQQLVAALHTSDWPSPPDL
ncbi:glutaredoxin family protein [Tessaracoccus sp. SD287]|uniref:glutaredoxin family protein n=1 Tax=Tessaracoccus sp. SD287 TaxID=2782008 RepID=UPI001A977FDE|nr:glutaredoxin family protein [Tessaracoccus sp. SD287]MBO1031792.1 glutaredoxin family protein [Tessaracoccus sp. SD287]